MSADIPHADTQGDEPDRTVRASELGDHFVTITRGHLDWLRDRARPVPAATHADTAAQAGAQALRDAAEEVRSSVRYGQGMRPDGTEDPQMSAYVEGIGDAYRIVSAAADRLAAQAPAPTPEEPAAEQARAGALTEAEVAGVEQALRDAAEVIWHTSREDEGTISATGADVVARALLDMGLLIGPVPAATHADTAADVIAGVLAEHTVHVAPISGSWRCPEPCGARSFNGSIETDDLTSRTERMAQHRAHVAAVLAAEQALAGELAEAARTALLAFADTRGVNVGSEDNDWWRGYRQAQRECLHDAVAAAERLAGDAEHERSGT